MFVFHKKLSLEVVGETFSNVWSTQALLKKLKSGDQAVTQNSIGCVGDNKGQNGIKAGERCLN